LLRNDLRAAGSAAPTTGHGLWEQIHHELPHRLQVAGAIDWSRATVDSISVRALKRGT
jgi:hypothetical protein